MIIRSLLALPVALALVSTASAQPPAVASTSEARAGLYAHSAEHSRSGMPSDTIPEATTGFTLTVVLTGASEDGGRIGAALFSSADDFLNDDRAAQRFVRPRTAAVDSFVFTGLEAGEYAIAAFHDTNGNGKIDKHWFGAPKESWGTSGDVRPRLRAPRFDEARVELAGDVRLEIEVKR